MNNQSKRELYSQNRIKLRRMIRKHRVLCLMGSVAILFFLCVCVSFGIKKCCEYISKDKSDNEINYNPVERPDIDVQLLTINDYSRPAYALEDINGIVIHYTANPGSTAMQNRNYFENLKDFKNNKVSSHFVVGLDGEIVQCIPSSEIAYASNDRNYDTLSIECCHPDETGQFNEATYESLVHLTAWLCVEFDVSTKDVIRHYDITGKACPKYFVENENDWEEFLEDVRQKIINSK